jgi:hypothetical protein
MVFRTQRAFHRNKSNTPARYEEVENGHFYDSRIVNFSHDGLCLEGPHPLPLAAVVSVNVLEQTPGAFGLEGCRNILGEVRWCKQNGENGGKVFDAGVRVISKKRDISDLDSVAKPDNFLCHLCGDSVLARHVTEVLEWVYLCPYCCRHFNALPQGRLKESIERYMVGNVV